MALPLPRVVSDVGPGGPIVTSMRGINALTQSNLENQYNRVKNKYAPYNLYADALSKIAYAQYLPYQLQGQALSNPLLWMSLKDNPELAKKMLGNFFQSVPDGSNVGKLPGGTPLPNPSEPSSSNSILGMLINKINPFSSRSESPQMGGAGSPGTQQGQSATAMPSNTPGEFGAVNRATPEEIRAAGMQLPSQDSTLVPGAKSGLEGIIGSKTAPFSEQVHKPGVAYADPNTGQIYSTPTGETVTASQSSINAAKRVEPQLQKLASSAAPFLTAGGYLKTQLGRAQNFLNLDKKKSELPTQYAKFQSLLQSAPEALVKSYGLRPTNETIERMQRVIEPYYGETGDQYKNRILNTLQELKNEQIGISQQQLSQGFQLTGNKSSSKNNAPSKGFDVRSLSDDELRRIANGQ